MTKLFLSYRREDSQDITGRMYDSLVAHFGEGKVFMDVDTIPLGVDFREHLSACVAGCDVFLAVIGNSWLDARHATGANAGKRRLDDPADYVRIEIAAALARGIPVIPILVGGATMPAEEQLPADLAALAYRNAAEVRSGRDFHSNIKRLIGGVEQLVQSRGTMPQQKPEPPPVKRTIPSAPALASSLGPAKVDRREVNWPTNLRFEGPVDQGCPVGWFDSAGHVSNVSIAYEIRVALRAGVPGKKCVQLRRDAAEPGEFGSLMQRWYAPNLAGKVVRLEAELKTDDLDAWAGLWLRIDSRKQQLFFDNMHDRPIRGTTPWTKYSLEAFVPSGAEWINYGILLVGNGVLSADNFQVAVVNQK